MQSNTPAAQPCGNCPLQHYPSSLLTGIDELSEYISALSAVADLLCPTSSATTTGADVNRSNLATLLTVLTRGAKWHLTRTEHDYYRRGKERA